MNNTVREPTGGQGVSPSPAGAALSVVLAGGGTAGHVEPAMAVADALSALDPMSGSPRWAPRAGWRPGWCPSAATTSS